MKTQQSYKPYVSFKKLFIIRAIRTTLFLVPLFCFSQSIDGVFLKQNPKYRGYFYIKDFALRGNVKTLKTFSYDYNTGLKEKKGNYDVMYFNTQGLLLKREYYKTDDFKNKTTETYHYSNNRIDSITGLAKTIYHYDYKNKNKLIKITSYGLYEDNKNEVDDEHYFFYNSNDYINKTRLTNTKMTITDKLDLKNKIVSSNYLYDDKSLTSSYYEFLYDEHDNCYGEIEKDKFKKIISKTVSKKNERKDITEVITTYINKKEKFINKFTYVYDKENNHISKITYGQNKKQNLTERKIEYYSQDEVNKEAEKLKTKSNQDNPKNENTEKTLYSQLKRGHSKYYNQAGVAIPQEQFTIADINSTAQISKKILSSQGYVFITQEKFASKIKEIFDRTIDFNSDKVYLYINNFDKCDRKFNYFPNNGIDYNGTYIVKTESFITDFYFIPELINYQKEFPRSIDVEKSINPKIVNKNGEEITTTLWKDIENNNDIAHSLEKQRKDNIQTIVARNMYLFNDSKEHGLWLRLHDEYFMKSLVTTFGYTKDKELLQWVIEKNRFKTESGSTNGQEYEKILWHKTCYGKLIVHKEVMEVMAKNFDKASPNYVDDLFDYRVYLEHGKTDTPLNFKEKAIILATIFNIVLEIEHIEKKGIFLHKVGDYYENNVGAKDLDKEFKLNNYYGLPHFKERWEEAKKEGDGINVPD